MDIQRHNIILSQCLQIQQVARITLEEGENYRLYVGDFYGMNLEEIFTIDTLFIVRNLITCPQSNFKGTENVGSRTKKKRKMDISEY